MSQREREVTEQDFRMPEYRDQDPKDYEFDANQKPVRKDRWKRAIEHIRILVGVNGRSYDISDVISAVKAQADDIMGWEKVEVEDPDDLPENKAKVDMRLKDGSILRGGHYLRSNGGVWIWQGAKYHTVIEWKRHKEKIDEPETDGK